MNALTRPTILTPHVKSTTAKALEDQLLRDLIALIDCVGFTDTERRLQRAREEASRARRAALFVEGWIA